MPTVTQMQLPLSQSSLDALAFSSAPAASNVSTTPSTSTTLPASSQTTSSASTTVPASSSSRSVGGGHRGVSGNSAQTETDSGRMIGGGHRGTSSVDSEWYVMPDWVQKAYADELTEEAGGAQEATEQEQVEPTFDWSNVGYDKSQINRQLTETEKYNLALADAQEAYEWLNDEQIADLLGKTSQAVWNQGGNKTYTDLIDGFYYDKYGGQQDTRDIRGENWLTDFGNAMGNMFRIVNTGIGTGVDAVLDSTLGNLSDLTGGGFYDKEGTTGETYAPYVDAVEDILLTMLGPVGIGVDAAKNLAQNTDNIRTFASGKDPYSGQSVSDAQKWAAAGTTALDELLSLAGVAKGGIKGARAVSKSLKEAPATQSKFLASAEQARALGKEDAAKAIDEEAEKIFGDGSKLSRTDQKAAQQWLNELLTKNDIAKGAYRGGRMGAAAANMLGTGIGTVGSSFLAPLASELEYLAVTGDESAPEEYNPLTFNGEMSITRNIGNLIFNALATGLTRGKATSSIGRRNVKPRTYRYGSREGQVKTNSAGQAKSSRPYLNMHNLINIPVRSALAGTSAWPNEAISASRQATSDAGAGSSVDLDLLTGPYQNLQAQLGASSER